MSVNQDNIREKIVSICRMYEGRGLNRPGRRRMAKLCDITERKSQRLMTELSNKGSISKRAIGNNKLNDDAIGGSEDEVDESQEKSIFPKNINPYDIGYDSPETESPQETIRKLRLELEEAKDRDQWFTNSAENEHRGGLFTLATSDFHYFDRGHLIETTKNLEDKSVKLINLFEPKKLVIVINGDIVTGRGIYRNQENDNILSRSDQQIAGAIFRAYEWDRKISDQCNGIYREFIVLCGNHDTNHGEPLVQYFVWGCRQVGMNMRYVGPEWIHNAASEGFHHILFEHGYGGSTFSPTGNKMVFETLRKLLGYCNRGYWGEKFIRRCCGSHTHWANIGLERAENVYFDTTGGLHRNDRTNIGANTRPTGWIAYISPPCSNDIIEPPPLIHPTRSILRLDMDDPSLEDKNRAEATRCLQGFNDLSKRLGITDYIKKTITQTEE